MVRLTFLAGSMKGRQAEWSQSVFRIGRAQDCDLRLEHGEAPDVSSHHAEIVRESGGVFVIDTASTNGTFVNGARVGKRRLASGDLVLFGHTAAARVELTLEDAPDPAAAGRAPPPAEPSTRLTPPPALPGESPEQGASRARRRPTPDAARVADEAANRVKEQRARAGGGSSGHTALIIADAVAEVHEATRRLSSRRWGKVVAAVGGVGLVVAASLGTVVVLQRREIRRLVSEKQRIDLDIDAVQREMARASDQGTLDALEDRLASLTLRAQGTIGELARQDRTAARELEDAGDELDRAIRHILVKFDARTYAVPPVFKQALQEQVDVLARSSNLKFIYRRRNRYWASIQKEFAPLGLPEEMAYIAWAETQFDPEQVSPAGAKGMWQMTASTARELGLRVDDEVDERLDTPKQTQAAARRLANLLAVFGSDSFMLAMASYNRGEAGVRRVLQQVAQEKDGFRKDKRDFWHLYRLKRLPTETMDYVPRVLAAAVVCNNPRRYGLEPGP